MAPIVAGMEDAMVDSKHRQAGLVLVPWVEQETRVPWLLLLQGWKPLWQSPGPGRQSGNGPWFTWTRGWSRRLGSIGSHCWDGRYSCRPQAQEAGLVPTAFLTLIKFLFPHVCLSSCKTYDQACSLDSPSHRVGSLKHILPRRISGPLPSCHLPYLSPFNNFNK